MKLGDERLRSVTENVRHAYASIGLQSPVGGEEEIRLGHLSTGQMNGVRRSDGSIAGANASRESKHVIFDWDHNDSVEERGEEPLLRSAVQAIGPNEAFQARKCRSGEKSPMLFGGLNPVSGGPAKERLARQGMDDDVRVERDEHQCAEPRKSSNSWSMSSFVRLPGGRASIKATRQGRRFLPCFSRRSRKEAEVFRGLRGVRAISIGDRVDIRNSNGSIVSVLEVSGKGFDES